MSKHNIFVTITITFLVSSILLYLPMGIDWVTRNQMEQVARAKVSLIRSELYIPQGVSVLKEGEGVIPPNSFVWWRCVSADITIFYGTNRPIDEIREEYTHGLTKASWELDPGYKHDDYYIVYRKGDEYHLTIDLLENFHEPAGQDFKVIYSVVLEYVTPSFGGNCLG